MCPLAFHTVTSRDVIYKEKVTLTNYRIIYAGTQISNTVISTYLTNLRNFGNFKFNKKKETT